jgi:ketosteroid isomerase-like protein
MSVEALIDFFHGLSPQSVSRLPEFYSADVWFKDPFNEVRGVAAVQRIFSHMFEQVGEPRFIVSESVVDDRGAMLIWSFNFQVGRWGGGKMQAIRGISHLKFDAAGKVNYHRDYWDAAEELYMKVPLLGLLMRGLQRALAAPAVGAHVARAATVAKGVQ